MRIKLTETIFCEQCPCSPWTWDLYRIYPGVRKGEVINVEKPMGIYGINLQELGKYLPDIQLQLDEDKVLELKEYISEFKKIQEDVVKELKESINKFKELKENGNIRQIEISEDLA